MKKGIRFLFSMKFALMILCLFVLVCIVGSVIPQGQTEIAYETAYPGWSGMILTLGVDDVFHSWWFVLLTVVLCVNLLGCNLIHFPGIGEKGNHPIPAAPAGEEPMLLTGNADDLLRRMGFRSTRTEDGIRYGIRNRIGRWGAWLTHLGILVIIVGFALGQIFTAEYTVYGVPGTTHPVGDTGYTLTIDNFTIALRDDDTVEQYTAELTLTDAEGRSVSGQSSVNHPWDAGGMRFYQNYTGWAADLVVYRGEELLQTETLCAGEYLTVRDREDLILMFRAFYPDLVTDSTGMPASASGRLNNPGYLYGLYYKNELLGMNVLRADEKITASEYTFLFVNPRSYTLLQIKRDPFTPVALLGGGILLVALFIAFYLRTEEIWILPGEDGSEIRGRSRKGSLLYREKLAETIQTCNEVSK